VVKDWSRHSYQFSVLSVAGIGEDRMIKDYVLGILFFSGLWGISEVVLGGALYRAEVPYASAPLTVIGLVILTFARVYFPRKGTATLIAACAMLYKFLNAPFFACHLLGIVLLGMCYDLLFGIAAPTSSWRKTGAGAAATAYLSNGLFALMITYVFRYEYWVQGGLSRFLGHVGIGGSIAALAGAVLVPVSFRLGERLKARITMPFALRFKLAPGSISIATMALWVFGIAAFIAKW